MKALFAIFICIYLLFFSLASQSFALNVNTKIEVIERGLTYLAKQQMRSGFWSSGSYSGAITALASLAFLSAGYGPYRGPYSSNIELSINALLKVQQSNGLIASSDERSPMFSHGFSTIFLSQVYGMTPYPNILKRRLERSISLITKSQSTEGGWDYSPFSQTDEGTLTVVQTQALRACRNVGLDVSAETIQRAIDYISKSQQKDGGIAYTSQSQRSTLPLTAAGMAVLFNAGKYEIGEIHIRGFQYLDQRLHEMMKASRDHFMFSHFYLAQVYRQRKEKLSALSEYYFLGNPSENLDGIETLLLKNAQEDPLGNVYWNIDSNSIYSIGPIYSTAMAVLILSMNLEYLPIFTR